MLEHPQTPASPDAPPSPEMPALESFDPRFELLYLAIKNGNDAEAMSLIDKGFDFSVQSEEEFTTPYKIPGSNCTDFNNYKRETALTLALKLGKKPLVHKMIDSCRQAKMLNAVNGFSQTALIVAAENGDTATVDLLLKKGANLEAVDGYGNTALMLAALNGHTAVVDLLIKAGAELDHQNESGDTALIRAAVWHHKDSIALLIKAGACLYKVGEDGIALEYLFATRPKASSYKDSIRDIVNLFIKAKINLDYRSKDSNTLIFEVHGEFLKFLIECGANLNLTDKDGDTAFSNAVKCRTAKAAQALYESGADVFIGGVRHKYQDNYMENILKFHSLEKLAGLMCSEDNSETSIKLFLNYAAEHNRADLVAQVIKRYKDIPKNIANSLRDEATAKKVIDCIQGSTVEGRQEILDIIGKNKATNIMHSGVSAAQLPSSSHAMSSSSAVNVFSETALIVAAKNGDTDTVDRLLKKDVNKEAVDEHGNTALMLAAFNGHKAVVDLLIKAGAELDHQNKLKATALILAAEGHHKDSVALLLEAGACLYKVNKDGRSALERLIATLPEGSSYKDSIGDIVNLFIKAKINLNYRFKDGITLIFGAHGGFLKFLIECGANLNLTNRKGETAFTNAVKQIEGAEEAQTLYEAGADVFIGGVRHKYQDNYMENILKFHSLEKLAGLMCSEDNSETSIKLFLNYAAEHNRADLVAQVIKRYKDIPKNIANSLRDEATAKKVIDCIQGSTVEGRQEILDIIGKNKAIKHFDLITAIDWAYKGAALIDAAKEENIVKVISLLEAGANIEAQNSAGNTALITAALNGHIGIVALLLKKGANIEAKGQNGITALIAAAANRHIDIVDMLTKAGANKEARGANGDTALIRAAADGYTDIVISLLKAGANKEARNEYGDTVLISAAKKGDTAMATLLLKAGANKEARDKYGDTALMIAVKYGKVDLINLLLKPSTRVNGRNKNADTALILAARSYKDDGVPLLLKKGAKLEARNKSGDTALIAAARDARKNAVEFLINAKAELETRNQDGDTALIVAAGKVKRGNSYDDDIIDTVELLLKAGANVQAKNNDGETALIKAVKLGNDKLVDLLLKNGAAATLEATDKSGKTALILAAGNGYPTIVTMLIQAGAVKPVVGTDLDTCSQMPFSPDAEPDRVELLTPVFGDVPALLPLTQRSIMDTGVSTAHLSSSTHAMSSSSLVSSSSSSSQARVMQPERIFGPGEASPRLKRKSYDMERSEGQKDGGRGKTGRTGSVSFSSH